MRFTRLIAAAAVSAGLAAPAFIASPAGAAAATCDVRLDSIEAVNVAERDGRDELRFLVDGNLFPRANNNHVKMQGGDVKYGYSFENPISLLSANDPVATFDLREVTLPAPGRGDSLGRATASLATHCTPLSSGQSTTVGPIHIDGNTPTAYDYFVTLRVTAN